MIKNKIRICTILTILMISALPIKASAAWVQESAGWKYMLDGSHYSVGNFEDNGKKYFADKKGIMQFGWVKGREAWYYATEDGSLKMGWLNDNGKWYYLSSPSGHMVTSGWAEDCYLESDGTWQGKVDKSRIPKYGDVLLEYPSTTRYKWMPATFEYYYSEVDKKWKLVGYNGMFPDEETKELVLQYGEEAATPKEEGKDGEQRKTVAYIYLGSKVE